MKVVVTGAAGYVGSHTVLELLEAGHYVLSLDNFANAVQTSNPEHPSISLQKVAEITGRPVPFKSCDLKNFEALDEIFSKEKFDAIIHLAALRYIGESTKKPYDYYSNNLIGSLNLIKICQKYKIKNFIFSSSATVYGTPQSLPITEECPTGVGVTNPYGQSKYMTEQILKDVGKADPDFNIIILRYFNPVGAHPSGLIGEDPKGIPSNLMPFIVQVATGKREFLTIHGNDYETKDGTGVRDYIHVVDLARGHVKALERIIDHEAKIGTEVYNLGTGKGASVLEMVEAFKKANQMEIPVKFGPRRPEDVPEAYCDPNLAVQNLDWKCHFNLEEMCRDHWNFQLKNPNGYQR